jgi:flavodoxin
MRCLVVYYSLEGSTRLVAEAIAAEIGADVVALRPKAQPPAAGFSRYLVYGLQRMIHPRMGIAPLDVDPQSYDLVFIGSPAWAAGPAPAVQTLLDTGSLKGKRVALFCTHRGGPGETLAVMAKSLSDATIVGQFEAGFVQTDPATARSRAAAWARQVAGLAPATPGAAAT